MANSISHLILQNLLLTFFVPQVLGMRVPVGDILKETRGDPFRLVYFALPRSNVPVVLYAGPANFGVDLTATNAIESTVEHVQPPDGCVRLLNNETIRGKIAIVMRGNCQFAEKALFIQDTGAVAGIVIDYNPGLSSQVSSVFMMNPGSVRETITIPLVFLYSVEGERLINASNYYPNLIVGITGKPLLSVPRTEELVTETPTTEEQPTEGSVMGGRQLSTMHIALICVGGLVVLILLAVSLGCWFRSTRKKSADSPDETHFSRLKG